MSSHLDVEQFMTGLQRRNPGQPEFHQAVQEVAETLIPYINKNPKYAKAQILERLTEPDRAFMFRVVWEDDEGNVRVNRGYRVQFSNAIGPYKGGLRFDKSVNLSILKFLGFEQVFKNSLTTLPMGGAKGGANFNPKGKSDREVMRFCQAFMLQLHNYIGKDVDVPAGDIGVGAREIGYLFGQYKRLTHESTGGTITGKGLNYGGSLIRTEATGYGAVYFAREMLNQKNDNFEGKVCLISGSGNVALYATQKLIELGAKVVTLSDRSGFIYDKNGFTTEKLNFLIDLKTVQRKSLEHYTKEFDAEFHADAKPWKIPCQMAFPCATQNEIDGLEAKTLLDNGCFLISEGANMPATIEAIRLFETAKILYAPGKAANAGGVATSGLEMSQNSLRMSWTREEVDQKLQGIMRSIHEQCQRYGQAEGHIDYVRGANIGGFVKVANTLMDFGVF